VVMVVVVVVVIVVVCLFPTSLPVSDVEEMRVAFYKDSSTPHKSDRVLFVLPVPLCYESFLPATCCGYAVTISCCEILLIIYKFLIFCRTVVEG